MSSKPKLHDDILIMIVEKMFFQKPEGVGNDAIDFRTENPYTFFMAHKPITETAFITQFAKLRRVEFENDEEEGRTIEFHKDEEESAVVNPNGLFTGPWRVSNMLLEEIIRRKKFRVTEIVTRDYLHDRDACELGTNASSLEAFCTLFLGKKLDIADSMKNDYDLAINKLELTEYPDDIKKNFEAIHAINSKELALINTNDEDLFSVCSSLPSSQFTADKTIKITIRSCINPDEFVISNLINNTNFFIETCPNLTTLYFDINTLLGVCGNAKDYVDKLNTILSSLMNEFLKPLDKGHSELKICLTWMVNCQGVHAYEDIPQDHELFTLGAELTTGETIRQPVPDIARIIKVADAKGREYECILAIYNEDL